MKCILLFGAILWCDIFILCFGAVFYDLDALEKAGEVATEGTIPAVDEKLSNKKENLIASLVRKVCNIAKGALKLGSKTEKDLLLTQIETKIRASPQISEDHDQEMYVDLIMKGIKLMVDQHDSALCNNTNSYEHIKEYLQTVKTRRTLSGDAKKDEEAKSALRKQELAKKVKQKMEILVSKSLGNVTTEEDKRKMLTKVKTKVINAFEHKASLKDIVNVELTRVINNVLKNTTNETRRYINDDQSEEKLDDDDGLFVKDIEVATQSGVELEVLKIVGLTTRTSCETVKADACAELRQLNEFKCAYDDHTFPLKLVCDGSIDCADGTDEIHCDKQAAIRIANSSAFMDKLKLHKHCFGEIQSNSLLSRQGALLAGVLKSQLDFIQKYTNINDTTYRYYNDVEEIAKEMLMITKTFNLAMSGAICMDAEGEADMLIRDTSKELDWKLHQIEKQIKISPKLCECDGRVCISKNCTSFCQRVCYQKYSLGRFSCKSVKGEGSVSLNEVCDGKLDCVDETDEMECVSENNKSPRFEAAKIYSYLLEVLEKKMTSKDLEPIWNHLKLLSNAVRVLQKHSMKPKVDNESFRILRQACFDWLVTAFVEVLDYVRNVEEGEEVYNFLMSINEKLTSALKHSHFGNDQVISSSECFCRGILCATHKCSKHCQMKCAVKPALTTYACGDVANRSSTYMDIDYVCNGKPNCPNGEDERNCRTDICRPHHLMVLRKDIKNLDSKGIYKGTILGDVIEAWKTKVISSITVVEKNSRPSLMDIRTLIRSILEDLVTSYVSMYDQRTAAKPEALQKTFKKFERMSQKIIDRIKSCGK